VTTGFSRKMAGAGLFLAALALAAPASAQLAAGGGPISYSADNLEYQNDNSVMILTGNVDLVQSCARLQASKLTLFFAPKPPGAAPSTGGGFSPGDIQQIVAEGDVHYVRPDQKARGDKAVYLTSTDSVTFTGNVVISSADNVIRGETLVLQIGTGRTLLSPSAKPGERVQGVIHLKQDDTKDEKKKQPAASAAGC
jgi:lipopolysaccharide export system protein LptA